MNMTPNSKGTPRPLRLWPGVAAVAAQWFLWFFLPMIVPQATIVGLFGGFAAGLAVLLWWLFFSRAPWLERLAAIVLMVAAAATLLRVPHLFHPSINGGMMGRLPYIYSIPPLCLALVVWAAATRSLTAGRRRAALVPAILLGGMSLALLRTDGVTGEGRGQFTWRWIATPEQRFLTLVPDALPPAPAPPKIETPAATPAAAPPTAKTVTRPPAPWPGFRGPHRDSSVTGVHIKTDWTASPPVQLWRRPVGPGWSSFAVGDGIVYTQEQRGEFEIVAAYKAATGEPVWAHRDLARFYESNGGAGPRGTPTLQDGRVYTLGATGIFNALDADTGAPIWTRNAASDTGAKNPGWGYTSSPLVVDDLILVATSGRVAAYDRASGTPRWHTTQPSSGYSSPHLLTIDGVRQVLFLNSIGATSFAPADGAVLWKHPWPGSPILQPAVTADGGILLSSADMMGSLGTRRLAVSRGADGWKVEEVWTSKGLKPYFNDFVVHNGHAYGFDGSILSCIDLKDGQRKWKGGRYGNGQMLLLRDQDLLLVLSEDGELALVSATPGQFTELARFPAMDDKTWNHPVVVGDLLLVRNGKEMVAFRLPAAGT